MTNPHNPPFNFDSYSLNDYQKDAASFSKEHTSPDLALVNWALGLTGESGELADEIKKFFFHSKRLDSGAIVKELGDILWYVSAMARTLGFSLEHVARRNIEKLSARHGESFKPHDEQNRSDKARE